MGTQRQEIEEQEDGRGAGLLLICPELGSLLGGWHRSLVSHADRGWHPRGEIARFSGLPTKDLTVHMTLCGESFGRRYQWDYAAEARQIAKEMKQPVQLLWTPEDDMQHDFYLQHSYHRLSGGLDARNTIVAWSHRVASTPIRPVFDAPEKLKDPKQFASQELSGADVLPCTASNFRLDYAPVQSAVREPGAWSVGHSFNAFAMECFVDELAPAAGRDP
jgi:isoquinoline 1-oxidoreductase beta subunit